MNTMGTYIPTLVTINRITCVTLKYGIFYFRTHFTLMEIICFYYTSFMILSHYILIYNFSNP
jgi:hypothetical protein